MSNAKHVEETGSSSVGSRWTLGLRPRTLSVPDAGGTDLESGTRNKFRWLTGALCAGTVSVPSKQTLSGKARAPSLCDVLKIRDTEGKNSGVLYGMLYRGERARRMNKGGMGLALLKGSYVSFLERDKPAAKVEHTVSKPSLLHLANCLPRCQVL